MFRARFFFTTFILGLTHYILIPGGHCEKIDWSALNSTISVVDPKITEINKFTYVECNFMEHGKVKICRVFEYLSQFNGPQRLCETSLTTSNGSEPEVWPFITPFNGKFIIPWFDVHNSGSTLVLRLTKVLENVKDCQFRDLNLGIRREEVFKVVPFNDSFEVIYDGGLDEISNKPLIFKRKFDKDGNQVGEPTSIFAELSSLAFYGGLSRSRSYLDLLKPVSPYDSSKGYFFVPLNSKLNQISILGPDGTITNTADLNVPLNSTVYSASDETIMLVSTKNNGTNHIYKILQIDSDLKAINNITYDLVHNRRLLKFENVFDTVLAVTGNREFKWGLAGEIYLEKLFSNRLPGKLIPLMRDVRYAHYKKFEVYKSMFDQKICINLLFKDGIRPKLKYTGCTALEHLDN